MEMGIDVTFTASGNTALHDGNIGALGYAYSVE
jgi:hypothetical protein